MSSLGRQNSTAVRTSPADPPIMAHNITQIVQLLYSPDLSTRETAGRASVEAEEAADRAAEPQGTAHHPRRPRAQRQGGPGAPELIREMWFFIHTEGTMKRQNKCQWLVIGSRELCRKSCLGDYCNIHLARLRRVVGVSKNDSNYVRAVVITKLKSAPGTGIARLWWPSFNVSPRSKFLFRQI